MPSTNSLIMQKIKSYKAFFIICCTIILVCLALFLKAWLPSSRKVAMSARNEAGLRTIDSLMLLHDTITAHFESVLHAEESRLTRSASSLSPAELYWGWKLLYQRSHLFKFDYSVRYSQRMLSVARSMNDPVRRVEALTFYGYSMARGGFFTEATEIFGSIRTEGLQLPDSVLASYYIYGGRMWHDLADYDAIEPYSSRYKAIGNDWLAKALPHISNASDRYYIQGKCLMWDNRLREARPYYSRALALTTPVDHERRSILLSTLANIDVRLGRHEQGTHYYIASVINDLRHSILETVAIRALGSDLFHNYHDPYKSSEYLSLALKCASTFGTRYRVNSMGSLLPVVEAQKQHSDRMRRWIMLLSTIVLTVLILLLIRSLISGMKKSRQLEESKTLLQTSNRKLDEANRIKNKYLGHYMDKASEMTNQANDFTVVALQKLKLKQYDAVATLLEKFQRTRDKKQMTEDFDATFISVFPSFVDDFNDLMTPEGRQEGKKPGSLTPALRIFALIRLGITDNNQIARVLDYSFNTVYNYRVRIRNKAKNPATFEQDVTALCI